MKIKTLVAGSIAIALVACSTPSTSQSSAKDLFVAQKPSLSEKQVLALFDEWNASLKTGDPQKVAALYASDAILIPTVSGKVRKTDAQRVAYFTKFLQGKPEGKIDQANIRVFETVALNSGLYTFTFADGRKVNARYTYVYEKQPDGNWLIVEHHSSGLPDA